MPDPSNDSAARILSPTVWAMLLGQWISILIAGTGVFASILSDNNANFPLLMSLGNYSLLSLYLFVYYFRRKREKESQGLVFTVDLFDDESISNKNDGDGDNVKVSKWIYLVAAILDVEANFLVIEAYNYTSITSVMLLDCFTIPCAMVLSYFFLGCRYRWKHGIGTALCLCGLVCIVINDIVNAGNDDSQSNALFGDILCLCGAVLYACSNVVQETLVKFHDREEYLGFMGGFGIIVSFIQFMIIDFVHVESAHFTGEIIGAMIGFIGCLFLMYFSTSAYLQDSDAILFNLSLLTSDVYAVIFTYFFYGYLVDWLYFLAFGLVIIGLFIYHSEKAPLHIGNENQVEAMYPKLLYSFSQCANRCSKQARSLVLLEEADSHNQSSTSSSSFQHQRYQQPINSRSHFDYNPIMQDTVHGSEE